MPKTNQENSCKEVESYKPDKLFSPAFRWIVLGVLALLACLLCIYFFDWNTSPGLQFLGTSILSLCVLVAICVQIFVYVKQARLMEGQLESLREQQLLIEQQSRFSAIQTTAMLNQGLVMRESLAETQKIVLQNERAVNAAEGMAIFAKSSADAAHRSADIAQQAMVVGMRPIVGIQDIQMNLGSGRVTLLIVNVGKSPAEHTSVKAKIVRVEGIEIKTQEHRFEAGGVKLFPAILPILTAFQLEPFTQQDAALILEGKQSIVIVGHIRYEDGFGNNEEHLFGFRYDPQTGWAIVPPWKEPSEAESKEEEAG